MQPIDALCPTVMGKAEGSVAREEWHGHVTALSVAPEFRRLGLAAKLMDMLEEISERYIHHYLLISANESPSTHLFHLTH